MGGFLPIQTKRTQNFTLVFGRILEKKKTRLDNNLLPSKRGGIRLLCHLIRGGAKYVSVELEKKDSTNSYSILMDLIHGKKMTISAKMYNCPHGLTLT